ncbi:unnamed protein product, partial [Polarella glacialis]
ASQPENQEEDAPPQKEFSTQVLSRDSHLTIAGGESAGGASSSVSRATATKEVAFGSMRPGGFVEELSPAQPVAAALPGRPLRPVGSPPPYEPPLPTRPLLRRRALAAPEARDERQAVQHSSEAQQLQRHAQDEGLAGGAVPSSSSSSRRPPPKNKVESSASTAQEDSAPRPSKGGGSKGGDWGRDREEGAGKGGNKTRGDRSGDWRRDQGTEPRKEAPSSEPSSGAPAFRSAAAREERPKAASDAREERFAREPRGQDEAERPEKLRSRPKK